MEVFMGNHTKVCNTAKNCDPKDRNSTVDRCLPYMHTVDLDSIPSSLTVPQVPTGIIPEQRSKLYALPGVTYPKKAGTSSANEG